MTGRAAAKYFSIGVAEKPDLTLRALEAELKARRDYLSPLPANCRRHHSTETQPTPRHGPERYPDLGGRLPSQHAIRLMIRDHIEIHAGDSAMVPLNSG